MHKTLPIMQALTTCVISISVALLPLFFLPFTQDYYDTNKWMLLMFTAVFVLVVWTVRSVSTGSYIVQKSGQSLALFALSLAGLASLAISSGNRVEAFLAPFGPGTFLSLTVIYALGSTFFDQKKRRILTYSLMASGALLGIIAVYQFFGLWKADPLWTPVGSSIGLTLILIFLLPVSLQQVWDAFRKKNELVLAVAIVCAILTTAGLGVTLWQVVPKLPTTLLPYSIGWTIVLESFKSIRQTLFGVGSENFLTAFTQSRPIWMNNGVFWNVRFTTSSSFIFHILTTWGALSVIGLIFLFKTLVMPVRLRYTLVVVSLLVAPPSLSALTILIGLFLLTDDSHWIVHVEQKNSWVHSGPIVFAALVLIASIYGLGRAYAAEMSYYQSLLTLRENQGTPTYNLEIAANQLNPNISRFHTTFSQTSLALADAMLTQALATQSGEPRQRVVLSDSDRQSINQLIQQSIREAKIGVSLAPRSVIAWENLASIYEAINRVATGADQWAIAVYQQAILLDPTNPVLRMRLGSVYVAMGNFEGARQQYMVGTALKPDYANAYYNLAFVLRQQKQYLGAAVALKTTQSLVQSGSADFDKVGTELADVTSLLTAQEKSILQESSSTPSYPSSPSSILSPVSEPQIQLSPRLELPTEASPSPLPRK